MSSHNVRFYPYDQVPVSDTTWSLHTGPDGRIYSSACSEGRGGVAVVVARYNDEQDALEYVLDAADIPQDPPSAGRAAQCKIHYGFAPSPREGILYAATHASAPGAGEHHFNVNADWGDERKAFLGSILMAYDTREERMLWSRVFIPREGCRCLAYDDERRQFYAVGWPRNHFLVYHLDSGELTDHGRIGSINPQAIWLDRIGRAYTTDDFGRILRYDPDADRLEETPLYLPRSEFASGWHHVVYDAVAAPDGESIFGVSWTVQPHLFRHWPMDGPDGRIEDLGAGTQAERNRHHPISFFQDHAGGLVFGADGMLYYVAARWDPSVTEARRRSDVDGHLISLAQGIVMQLDPDTYERKEIAELDRGDDKAAHYVSRGSMDRNGDLFFGNILAVPSGIFRVEMNCPEPPGVDGLNLRMWG